VDRHYVLPRTPEAPSLARRLIADACDAWGLHTPIEANSQLMTSEIVTNALVHGGGTIELSIEREAQERIRVQVHDQGPGPDAASPEPSVSDDSALKPSGRGLLIIEDLAVGWGIEFTATGTCTWFVAAGVT